MILKIHKMWGQWSGLGLLALSVVCVGVGSYMLGLTRAAATNQGTLHIVTSESENTTLCSAQCLDLGVGGDTQNLGDANAVMHVGSAVTKSTDTTSTCSFIGSKSGTKYYPPSCKTVNRIKPENLICFISELDAQEKGYARTKTCK
jgi:hypothetical protein